MLKGCKVQPVAGAVLLTAAVPFSTAFSVSVNVAKPKPNIVLMLADDLGYGELSCYGSKEVHTPNLDRLARDGARFTDGYALFPVCSPSRAALLTGRYPQRNGKWHEDYFGGGVDGLHPDIHPTLGGMLKETGYATAAFGKWNVSHVVIENGTAVKKAPNDFGFDRWVGLHLNHDYYTHRLIADNALDMYVDGKQTDYRPGVWSDTVFADEAVRFIKDNKDRPFFIYLAWQAPHDPIQDPDIPFDPPKKNMPENRPLLVKMIERLDLETGRVLSALEANGIADNTLVIFTSDNGGAKDISCNVPLRGCKQELWEGGIRVPLIVRWPGVTTPGQEITAPVHGMDLSATVAAAGGAESRPAGEAFDGSDLRPLLAGTGYFSPDRAVFFRRRMNSVSAGTSYIRQSAVRQGDWKYMRNYPYQGSGTFGANYTEVLYNLRDDIAETANLRTSMPEKFDSMRQLLIQWENEVTADDAMLNP
jgi:arylsulfatase A-like enzyme